MNFLVLHEETEAPSISFLNFLVLHEETEAPSSSFWNFLVLHEEKDPQGPLGEFWTKWTPNHDEKGSPETLLARGAKPGKPRLATT